MQDNLYKGFIKYQEFLIKGTNNMDDYDLIRKLSFWNNPLRIELFNNYLVIQHDLFEEDTHLFNIQNNEILELESFCDFAGINDNRLLFLNRDDRELVIFDERGDLKQIAIPFENISYSS